MIKVNFSANARCPFNIARVKKILELASFFSKKIKGEVEVNIIGDKLMKKLNKSYLGKNETTDVLSFAWREIGDAENMGQIFISYPQIKRQAKEYKISADEEFTRMLAHGILHLAGYSHNTQVERKKMFRLQEDIVKNSVKRPRDFTF